MQLDQYNTRFNPTAAILLYEISKNIEDSQLPEMVLEYAEFIPEGERFILGAPRPLAQETINYLASCALHKAKQQNNLTVFTFKSIIPSEILYVRQSPDLTQTDIAFVLYKPKRALYFSNSLNIQDGEISLPNLVFIYRNKALKVFAFKDDQITQETMLYRAPFHNTGSSVCMGSARINTKSNYWEDLMLSIDTAFFSSTFTQLHGPQVIDGNLNTVLDDCISNGKQFPEHKLIALNKSLKSELV